MVNASPESITLAPNLSWSETLERMAWRQGEHTTLIGPTGQGKTTLALHLLREREKRDGGVIVIATKPRDRVLSGLTKRGYRISRKWPPNTEGNRIILWPSFKRLDDIRSQRATIHRAMADIFSAEAWTVYIDELPYFVQVTKLGKWAEVFWMQGRALDITLVTGSQRPRHVPLAAYSQATHLFLWRTNDEEDLRRISGLGTISSHKIRQAVMELPQHHALYVNTRTDMLATVKAPPPEG